MPQVIYETQVKACYGRGGHTVRRLGAGLRQPVGKSIDGSRPEFDGVGVDFGGVAMGKKPAA